MKIYSMTATFGKLEHESLHLRPGLNIIEAPNEWGKSTWCAFLVAMLYGIDTRERTKLSALADKERYAPWSGSPMSGRMELSWNGRDITIERSTKGRSIFGQFRAYETQTGLDVPELTATNCGELLLGVEKSVFMRSGFLRLSDLPVTQDESLRRRLNALVTTGDESGASDLLAQKLKDLKNHCRSNRANGLIPKAEAQKAELEEKLRQISQLRDQSQRIRARQEELSQFAAKLENHRAALEYEQAREHARQETAAKQQLDAAAENVARLEAACGDLPDNQTLLQSLSRLKQLRAQFSALQMDAQMCSVPPDMPQTPAPFRGCTPEQAVQHAREDRDTYRSCLAATKKPSPLLWIIGLLLLLAGGVLLLLKLTMPGMIVLPAGLIALICGIAIQSSGKARVRNMQAQADRLLQRYHPLEVDTWEASAIQYAEETTRYETALEQYRQELAAINSQLDQVTQQITALTGGKEWTQCEQEWQTGLDLHRAYADALRELRRDREIVQALTSPQKLPPMPQSPDDLTFSMAETARLLADVDYESRQLQHKLGHCQGQMESLGSESPLRQQLDSVNTRIAQLEDTYAALEIAQQTLIAASAELQRKFAPRIARRAQELFGKLTGSRYDRLTLGEDLSVSAGALGEDTLRGSMWRSDGTVDQLYLALRLAVAEELTADAPLILDDALVRFDDRRLAVAMEILKECAQNKQVILFTCQSRETAFADQ